MIPWNDTVCVLFTCVAANHLGLIGAVEKAIHLRLPVINCPKCLTFWGTLALCLSHRTGIVEAAAVSLLGAYAAIWLELIMGIIDKHYTETYEKTYPDNKDHTDSADTNNDSADSSVSRLQENI